MALHTTFEGAYPRPQRGRVFPSRGRVLPFEAREAHDLAPMFWSIAFPASLLLWAAIAYGIHSAL